MVCGLFLGFFKEKKEEMSKLPAIGTNWHVHPSKTQIKDSDQPGHLRRLIRVFDGCSVGSQGSNVPSGFISTSLC